MIAEDGEESEHEDVPFSVPSDTISATGMPTSRYESIISADFARASPTQVVSVTVGKYSY